VRASNAHCSLLTAAVLIGLARLHPLAAAASRKAFHSGGGLSVEKVQHLDPC
jgi:hypothetical protein